MTPELTALTLAALLQMLQLTLYSVAGQKQVGTRTALKPRDEGISLTGKAGRIQRAMNNHFEGLILFGIGVMVITYSGKNDAMTALASGLYLLARILYIPAYVFGWVPWRSLIWAVGFFATLYLLLAALM
ncbi:MAPEG family protein [Marivita geojedonensis]|uniref:Membrane protein n=1 Tax=Marivita geojedonensis TaxID=1123756 RepID=A0A1X4NQ03_9RHOB|nr:MAPEG family protein [Marivita geojedonensis]OSQ53055.1 membrane protein [Marivita geojedonensis]PRY82032.1 putative MAPEG superfamily protein [Marivita geojedonensis]